MKLLTLLIFLTAFILNESCTSTKSMSQEQDKGKNSDSLFFSLERTPCYGKCPVYKVNIYQSGYATLEAIRNVGEKSGMYDAGFSKEEMKMLKDKAEEVKYFDMENEYDSPVTDLPSVITSLNADGKKKKIRNRHHGPPELKKFEKFADELINGKEWKKVQGN